MKSLTAWIRFLTGYTLKKKIFWCMLTALALISGAALLSSSRHQVIRIALYCENPDSMTNTVLNQLQSSDDGLYRFYVSPSLSYLQEDVAARKAECGYLFPDGLEALLQENTADCIQVYTSSSTVLADIVNEAVYNALFQEYAKTMLADYIEEHGLVDVERQELEDMIRTQYEWEKENTPVFHVVYEKVSDDFYDDQSLFRIPVRGLLSLLLLLTALAGGSQFRHDRKRGFFVLRRPDEKNYVPLLYSLLPSAFTAVAGFLCLILSGTASLGITLIPELLLLLGAAILYSLLSWILGRIISSSLIYDALIPVLLLFCLLYSPVLMDLSGLLPAYGVLSWLAPASWYLKPVILLSL